MKVVIAPQAFKGSLGALDVSQAIERGVKQVGDSIETVIFPLADGGDGTLDVFKWRNLIDEVSVKALDAAGNSVKVPCGIMQDKKTVVIETAKVCGLAMLSERERNPLLTSTYGLGVLIKEFLDRGFRRFIIGLGGSGTCDVGMGMMQALGASFYDYEGHELDKGGKVLTKLARFDLAGLDPRLLETQFTVAWDVSNPLMECLLYAPQKGASLAMMVELEDGLRHYIEVVEGQLGKSISKIVGGGSAGGTGAAFKIFLNSTLTCGADFVMDMLGFDQELLGADLVIVGEGRMDRQTNCDKIPIKIAERALERKVPVLAIVGSIGDGIEEIYSRGIKAVIPLSFMPLNSVNPRSSIFITAAAEQAVRCFKPDVPPKSCKIPI